MAIPTNKTSLNSTAPVSSEVVVWEGPNIPCIELCTGEKVSGVVAKIGTILCELVTDINDLETLDYTCIVSKFGYTNPQLPIGTNFSLKLLFQLLLENDCKLKDLIDSIIPTTTATTVNLTGLNFSCITSEIINLCGVLPENPDILKVTQAIINILCGIQDDVADMLIRIISIETQISALGDPGSGGYTEPNIISCLSPLDNLNNPIPTLMSTHLATITDSKICELQSLVGTPAEVSTALSKQCLSDYVGNININQSASNLAQSAANKEEIICDLINRITLIESTCCSKGCGDIRIGFVQSYDSTTNTYTIDFTYGAGTDIPGIFTDCGSIFIITDWKGVTKTVTNSPGTLINGSQFLIDLTGSGLDISKPMNLQIKTCYTNTVSGIICKDCFGGSLDASSTASTLTCWDFDIPKTDVLGCSGKFIDYHSLVTTQGTYLSGGGNTSVSGNIVMPTFQSPNNILNNIICNNNRLVLTLDKQSTTSPPELKLKIVATPPLSPALYISVVGTINNSCGC